MRSAVQRPAQGRRRPILDRVEPSRELSRRAFLVAAAFEGSLALFAWIGGELTGTETLSRLRASPGDIGFALLATLPPLLFLLIFMRVRWAPFVHIREVLDRTMLPLFKHCTLDELLALALLAGVGEELLFRAWMQGWATELTGPVGALIVVSFVFAMAHAVTRAYAVLAGLISLYLGSLLLVRDSVMVPVIVHALYDAVAFVLLFRRTRSSADPG